MKTIHNPPLVRFVPTNHRPVIQRLEILAETEFSVYVKRAPVNGIDATETVSKSRLGKLYESFAEAKAIVIMRRLRQIRFLESELEKEKILLDRANDLTPADVKEY